MRGERKGLSIGHRTDVPTHTYVYDQASSDKRTLPQARTHIYPHDTHTPNHPPSPSHTYTQPLTPWYTGKERTGSPAVVKVASAGMVCQLRTGTFLCGIGMGGWGLCVVFGGCGHGCVCSLNVGCMCDAVWTDMVAVFGVHLFAHVCQSTTCIHVHRTRHTKSRTVATRGWARRSRGSTASCSESSASGGPWSPPVVLIGGGGLLDCKGVGCWWDCFYIYTFGCGVQ